MCSDVPNVINYIITYFNNLPSYDFYTITGLPPGVTVSSFDSDGAGGTTATLTLAGTPAPPLTDNVTVTVAITAAALNGALASGSTTFDITDEVVTATGVPSPVNESASLDQVFTITLTEDQLTAGSTTVSIGAAVTLAGDLTGLTKGTVVKSSLGEYTIQLTGNLVYATGSGTITLNNSELADVENAVATITITDVAPTASFGTASIDESATDAATNILTVVGDTFSFSGAMTAVTHYTITGLPSGVTVSSFDSDGAGGTTATLTLAGSCIHLGWT